MFVQILTNQPMIRMIRGTVVVRGKDHLVVDIGNGGGGIAFKILVPEPTAIQNNIGSEVLLNTYLQVREDALTLFGFASEDELSMFEMLLTVSGVGPKMALGALSAMSTDALRLALASEEPAILARIPGVGKRTAEKIVLELKDKVKGPGSATLAGLSVANNADTEVIEALIALGYSVVESQRAVQSLPKDVTRIEERLRLALSKFSN